MKTYFSLFRILSIILLVGLIAIIIVFRSQNWEINSFFYVVAGFLIASIILDMLKNR